MNNHPVKYTSANNFKANDLTNYAKVNSLSGPDIYAKIGGSKKSKKKSKKKKSKKSNKKKRKNSKHKLKGGGEDEQFIISTYNILARGNTHYNWRCHRNIPDIHAEGDENWFKFKEQKGKEDVIDYWIDSDGEKLKTYESPEQTKERYKLVSEDILKSNSDIVCLQECDVGFFETEFNSKAEKILSLYNRLDNLDVIIPEKQSGGGPSILVKKTNKFKKVWTDEAIYTEYNDFGGTSKGAVFIPVEDKKNNPLWVVSAHFNSSSDFRTKLVSEIEKISKQNHPSKSKKDTILVVMGDFNLEGPAAKSEGRQDLMAYEYSASDEYDDKTAWPKITTRIKSDWYNSHCHLPPYLLTGLTGDFSQERNIDHVFITDMQRFKKIDQKVFDAGDPQNESGDRGHPFGPFDEIYEEAIAKAGFKYFKFSNRIGGSARNNQLKLKHITDFRKSKRGPGKIVRGSDHKMVVVIFDPK
jgi:endonuclease/exonuclease/phosphatase family metal-dependent hydrolase